jgi:beta-lactam-binding protein with PASTA domain
VRRRLPPYHARAARGWQREIPARVRRYFDERRLLKYVLITGLSMFVVGYLVMTFLFFPGFGRSPIVTVPDLTGRSAGQAERAVERLGLDMVRGGQLPNPRVGRGRVLMQTPLPGEEVARGTQVRIVLSSGPESRVVPAIKGLSRADAVVLLQRHGFRVSVRTMLHRSEEGSIIGLRPEAGKPAPLPGPVELLISAGPPKVLVPSVAGLVREHAAARLQAVSLHLGRVSYDPASTLPAGTVVAQAPAAGDSLRMGSSVRITLAGADPNPPPPPTADSLAVDSAAAEPVAEEPLPDPEPEPEEPPRR